MVAVEEGVTVQLLALALAESVTLTACPTVVCVADEVSEICEMSLDFLQAAKPNNISAMAICFILFIAEL